MIKIDNSEVKEHRSCGRKWDFTSRNRMHLTPTVTPKPFVFGTIFHKALADLYMGSSIEGVMKWVKKEVEHDEDLLALLAMIPGYAENVLIEDLERFKVLETEWHFELDPEYDLLKTLDVKIVGSIDLVVLDRLTNKIYGFEHKTCKSFRSYEYIRMDEQPRLYTWALQRYAEAYNAIHADHVQVGGVYLNEVKKLLRKFDYKRTLCVYKEDDLKNFMSGFYHTCLEIAVAHDEVPTPSYMGCQMCSFKNVCCEYGYGNITKADVLMNFGEDFMEREGDHLDEKEEQSASSEPETVKSEGSQISYWLKKRGNNG